MKKNLLIAALAVFGCASAFAQEAGESVTERLVPTADTYLRMNNTGNNGGKSTMEIWTATDEAGEITQDFVGLMAFSVPEKAGYDVAKATLVLHADMVKGDPKFAVYPFDYEFAENDTYETHAANVESARGEEAIASEVDLNGWRGHAVGDVNESTDEVYRTADGWKTEIDVTDYVLSKAGGYVGLLFYQDAGVGGTNGRSVKIYTKEAEDVVNEKVGFTLNADDIKPYLLVEYAPNGDAVESQTVYVTSDVTLNTNNRDKADPSQAAIEMYTQRDEQGAITKEYLGLMSFDVTLPDNAEIDNATLVLYTERAKGTLAIHPFGNEISDEDTYNTQESYLNAARENEPVATVRLAGTNNKAVTDNGASNNINDWRNEIDVTEYVKSVDGAVRLMLCNNATSTTTSIKVYSSDVEDVTLKDGTVFKADDLKPRLVVTYTVQTPSGISEVVTDETVNKGKEGIYTLSGVRVAKADRPGIYIINGKKVLVRNR